MSVSSKWIYCMVGFCLVCTTACRSSNWQSPQDVAALQAQRRSKVEKSIGLKQSEAELQLARDAWSFGDRRACLSALDDILEREPGHVEALLLKAEVQLASDDLIDADRSIAIALSHDPSNATAKRLGEMVKTKQLAEQRHDSEAGVPDADSAPLPAGAISRAAYEATAPGVADVEDALPVAPGAGGEFAGSEAAAGSAPSGPVWVLPPAGFAECEAEQPTFFEPLVPLESPFLPIEDRESEAAILASNQAGLGSDRVRSAVSSLGEEPDPVPVILKPEEAVAYECSDVPAGSTEVWDQSWTDDSAEMMKPFESAIAAGDSAAALATVETQLMNNPDDPQIPISATVGALEANQPETAASIARLGIAFHPSCAALHRTLGAALYRSGHYTSSQVALQQALSLDNSSALSYFLMGCVSEKLGNAEAAERNFARATELDPTIADRE